MKKKATLMIASVFIALVCGSFLIAEMWCDTIPFPCKGNAGCRSAIYTSFCYIDCGWPGAFVHCDFHQV